MGKIRIESCLISARGLRRTPSFFNLQWFAVGWVDLESKYCTKIDTSKNGSPAWNTRFSTAVDASDESRLRDLALHVEVYSREPIFLRRSLLGSATISLREFLDKFDFRSDGSKPVEEVGSFQLRKKGSNKPLGLVDVSVRITAEKEEKMGFSSVGRGQGFNLSDHKGGINPAAGYAPPPSTFHQSENAQFNPFRPDYFHHHHHHPAPIGPSHYPPQPSPPSIRAYAPVGTLRPHGAPRPGFGVGVGGGVMAAAGAAAFFGDDFMSGFDISGDHTLRCEGDFLRSGWNMYENGDGV